MAAAQRGTLDLGDPEVRATRDAVRAALGAPEAAAALARYDGCPRERTLAVLDAYASATSRA